MYKRFEQLDMIGYSSSDFTQYRDSRKSTFGYLFILANGEFSWQSAKESIVVSSTVEAEFMAYFKVTTQGLCLRNFILGIGVVDTIIKLLKIYCDNFVTIFFSKNDKYYNGAKHVELKYLVVKEYNQNQKVLI